MENSVSHTPLCPCKELHQRPTVEWSHHWKHCLEVRCTAAQLILPPPLFAKVVWKGPMCISMSTLCELILLSTNCLVSPKDTEAMVGWCPNSGSPSVCHETWSCLSRYKLHNTEFSVKLICFSTLVLILCKDGGHCGWKVKNNFG